MHKTLMVLAAGLGQRYGGLKQVAPVGPNGQTLLYYAIHDAIQAGFDKIVFIIKREIEREFVEVIGKPASEKVQVAYAFQDEAYLPRFYQKPNERKKMLGTVHAMLAAKDIINEPFAIINADDYYGQEAFATISKFLPNLEVENDIHQACMVGYELKNTVSENGAVTRGVCETKHGKLVSVTETYKVQPFADGTIRSLDKNPDGDILTDNSIVSMNFWGFAPSIFKPAVAYFDAFLKNLPADDLTSEYVLPTMVDDMIKAGILEVTMLTSPDTWMGLTFPEDKEAVQQGLLALYKAGKYKENTK